jgi:hypothetical protein
MYRPQRTTVFALPFLLIEIAPTVAATKIEHHHTRRPSVAALVGLLDLQGTPASLGRPATNGFVRGLQTGTEGCSASRPQRKGNLLCPGAYRRL